MRLLLASLVAVTAVAFAAPSFAQDSSTTAPIETPAPAKHTVKHKTKAKAKAKTTASTSCSAVKSQSSKSACLKRHAHAKKPHKTTKKVAAAKPVSSQIGQPTEAAPALPPAAPPQSQSVAVPPLPQKTI
jgi:hypothetical protein